MSFCVLEYSLFTVAIRYNPKYNMVQDVIIDEDHTITLHMADGSAITKTPTILEEQAEELLHLLYCML